MRQCHAILIASGLFAGLSGMPLVVAAQTLVISPDTGEIVHEAADPTAAPAEAEDAPDSAEMKKALQAATKEVLEASDAALMADSTLALDVQETALPHIVSVTIIRSSDSGDNAKKQAQGIIRREAFATILRRQAPERADALLQLLDQPRIDAMIAGADVLREQMTASTYQSAQTIRFDPKKLEALLGSKLKKRDVPAQAAGGQVGDASLVIPVWQEGDQYQVWEPENSWRKALNRAALQESKGKLVMPYGDPLDQLAVTTVKIPTLHYAEVAHLAQRYGTSDVLIVQATPVVGNGLNLTLTRMDAKGQDTQQQLITVPPTQSKEQLLATAASYVADLARQKFQTRREGEVEAQAVQHRIRAIAPITRAADWVMMRKRLSSMAMIDSLMPINIGPDEVEMEIVFHGPPDAFGVALKSANIHATPQGKKLLLGFYPVGGSK